MDIIEQNPYRILGVLSNSPKKEIVANLGKIKAFSKTGRSITFENDFLEILHPFKRTEENSTKAYNAITLPKDKLSAGLFWFMQTSNIDEIALNHLRKGEFNNAIKILSKVESIASFINLAVINLIKHNWTTALYYYVHLLNDNKKSSGLQKIITDNPELLSEKEIAEIFVDKLLLSFPNVSWVECVNQSEVKIGDNINDIQDFFRTSNIYEYITKRCSEADITKLEASLNKAASTDNNNAKQNLKAAKTLEEESKLILHSLRICLGKNNKKYRNLCDKVANQILDNCIDYYNHDKGNPLRPRNILKLLRYAHRTAEGRIAKERCKNNFEHIKNECDSLVPEEIESDVSYINKQIQEFNKLNSASSYAGYLNATLCSFYQKLERIKECVGEDSKHYYNTSSVVVNFAIDIIFGELNKKLGAYDKASDSNEAKVLMELRSTLNWGKPILETIKTFAKDTDCTDRYNKSMKAFYSLYERFHIEHFSESSRKEYLNILLLAPSTVKVGEKFQVKFSIKYKGATIFAPPSFRGITVLAGPSKNVVEGETIYSYHVQADHPGTAMITPASIKINNTVYNSSSKTIKVNAASEQYNTYTYNKAYASVDNSATKKPNNETNDTKIGWIIGIFITGLILLLAIMQCNKTSDSSVRSNNSNTTITSNNEHNEDVSTQETDNILEDTTQENYTVVNYDTGEKPYSEFYGNGQYDRATKNSLLIRNGSATDAVVFLETLDGKKIRHVYVKKGESFKMTQIPGGKFITKIIQGNNWNPDKSNGPNAPEGGFMDDISMSKSEEYDPFDYPFPSTGHYLDYEITLYKVKDGNMSTENINTEEMF